MPDLSNNSFIPKRGPVQRRVSSAARPVYLFTFFSYLLMFSTLIASGGVFVYEKIVERQYQEELSGLRADIADFKVAQMNEVLHFDRRLQQVTGRVEHSVSLTKIFRALETATIDTVMFNELQMQREGDDDIALTIGIDTDTFDSTIFQRGTYIGSPITAELLLTDVSGPSAALQTEGDDKQTEGDAEAVNKVSFVANIIVPISDISFDPATVATSPLTKLPESPTDDEDAVLDQSNEENL